MIPQPKKTNTYTDMLCPREENKTIPLNFIAHTPSRTLTPQKHTPSPCTHTSQKATKQKQDHQPRNPIPNPTFRSPRPSPSSHSSASSSLPPFPASQHLPPVSSHLPPKSNYVHKPAFNPGPHDTLVKTAFSVLPGQILAKIKTPHFIPDTTRSGIRHQCVTWYTNPSHLIR
jgi:hypothetical protein